MSNQDREADKQLEHARYDSRASQRLAEGGDKATVLGALAVPLMYRAPYIYYETCVRSLAGPGKRVLELGSGAGLHTGVLLDTGAEVTATDISLNALELLARSVTAKQGGGRLRTEQADMEKLPFPDRSFDLVVSAGSLSYGEPSEVDREVRRVLAPGGSVVCVDSLSHNPIYRFNRWVHYLRGERTWSTLSRMPTIQRLDALAAGFRESDLRFFGSVSWAMGPLARLTGEVAASTWSDRMDRWVDVRASAFKFVLVARHLA